MLSKYTISNLLLNVWFEKIDPKKLGKYFKTEIVAVTNSVNIALVGKLAQFESIFSSQMLNNKFDILYLENNKLGKHFKIEIIVATYCINILYFCRQASTARFVQVDFSKSNMQQHKIRLIKNDEQQNHWNVNDRDIWLILNFIILWSYGITLGMVFIQKIKSDTKKSEINQLNRT